jgi:hypothetical protein
MLKAEEVQAFLRQFEPLREISVDESSQVVFAPWLVRVHGSVMIYGEPHAFEAELDLREFGGAEDLMKLVEQLLKSFAAAAQVVNAKASVA